MINRQYVVKMPTSSPAAPLYILVQDDPGTQDDPVVAGTDGAYYELRGRPIRFETVSGDTGFVPRMALGFHVDLTPMSCTFPIVWPEVQFSASLIQNLSSTDSGPTIQVPTFADATAGGPAILVQGNTGTEGNIFLLTLSIAEAKDEDRQATASP